MENIEKNNSKQLEKDNKMRTTPIGKLLFTMALPAIFSMLVQALYNVVDSLYVSRISEHSNDELNALNYAFPIQMICLAISLGIGIGASSVISRRLGERNQASADLAAKTGIILSIIAYFITLACSFFVPTLFMKIYTDSNEVKALSIQYLTIVMAFSIGSYLEVTITKILQGTGNMIVPMLSQLIGAITNIILDPIFIFKPGQGLGLPFGLGLGVSGAAIATVIGQCVAGTFVICVILFQKQQVNFNLKDFRFESKTLQDIFNVGISVAIMNSINALTTIILNLILSSSGVTILGTYFKVQSFIFMPIFGLTQGAMPIMGYNFGAKLKHRFLKTVQLSLIVSLSVMTFGLLLFQFGSKSIANAFQLGDTTPLAVQAFRTISICFIPAAISIIISSMFQAIGHGYKSMLMSLLRQAVILIPCALLLKLITHSDQAVWWSYPISETLCCLIFVVVALVTIQKISTHFSKSHQMETDLL